MYLLRQRLCFPSSALTSQALALNVPPATDAAHHGAEDGGWEGCAFGACVRTALQYTPLSRQSVMLNSR
jgi:hypothetical protein